MNGKSTSTSATLPQRYLLRAGWEVGCNDSDVRRPLCEACPATCTYHVYQTRSTNHLKMTSQKGLGLSTTTFWGVMMWQHLYKSHLPQKGNVNSATTLETLAINFIQIFFKQMNQISLSFPLPKGKQWKTCCPFSCEFFQEIIVWYWSCWMASRWSTGVVIPYKCQCPTHRSWSRIKDGILDGQQRMVHLKKWLVSFPSSVHLQVFSAFKGLIFRRSMWRFRGLWTICLAFFLPFCSAKHRFSLC